MKGQTMPDNDDSEPDINLYAEKVYKVMTDLDEDSFNTSKTSQEMILKRILKYYKMFA